MTLWAVQYPDGTWRSPDHFVSSRTPDSQRAKPFYGKDGKFYAELFAKQGGGAAVPHPHPELWCYSDSATPNEGGER